MTTKKASKTRVAGTVKRPNKAGAKRGNFTKNQIKALQTIAHYAYKFQCAIGNVDYGQSFNDWRHAEVMTKFQLPGVSALNNAHFREAAGHFFLLWGKDEKALENFLRTGLVKDNGKTDDTHEKREEKAFLARDAIARHVFLAEATFEQLVDFERERWEADEPEVPFPGVTPKWIKDVTDARDAIEKNGGPVRDPYAFTIAHNKTGCTIRGWGDIVERMTAWQIQQLHFTVGNRIADKEGRGDKKNRNKKQRSPKAKAARSRKEVAPRF